MTIRTLEVANAIDRHDDADRIEQEEGEKTGDLSYLFSSASAGEKPYIRPFPLFFWLSTIVHDRCLAKDGTVLFFSSAMRIDSVSSFTS